MSAMDSCVSVYACRKPRISNKENEGKLVVNFHVSTAQTSFDPTQPLFKRKLCRRNCLAEKTFNYEQKTFLSSDEAQQREITSTMIQVMEIPFLCEDLYWANGFPTGTEPLLENMEKVVDRLLNSARLASKQEKTGFLDIQITKWEKVPLDKYRKLYEDVGETKVCLADWMKENMNDLNADNCLKFLFKYRHMCSKENPYFGLKPVISKKEENRDDECCAICKNDMKKIVIQMPCSHVFHGLCLFRWLVDSPTCPLCRFDLIQQGHKHRLE